MSSESGVPFGAGRPGLTSLFLAGSPFRVPVKDVVDPGKVKCSGPGLGAGVRARVPQTFTVDCSQAGRAPLQVAVLGPTGTECLGPGGRRQKGCQEALLTVPFAQVWPSLWRCVTMGMAPTPSTTPQPRMGPTQ